MDTGTESKQIEVLLELGCHMGPGERYLMMYEGILTITNRTGLAHWPRGNRRVVAIFDAADCIRGLPPQRWDEILGRLQRMTSVADAKVGEECYCKHGPGPIVEQMPKEHPT